MVEDEQLLDLALSRTGGHQAAFGPRIGAGDPSPFDEQGRRVVAVGVALLGILDDALVVLGLNAHGVDPVLEQGLLLVLGETAGQIFVL